MIWTCELEWAVHYYLCILNLTLADWLTSQCFRVNIESWSATSLVLSTHYVNQTGNRELSFRISKFTANYKCILTSMKFLRCFEAFWGDFGGPRGIERGSWGHLGEAWTALGADLEMSRAAWWDFNIDKTNFAGFGIILGGLLGTKIRSKRVPGKRKNCKSFRHGFSSHFWMLL